MAEPASAGGLTDLYRLAEQADPVYTRATRLRMAADEAIPLARAGLLPQLSLGASVNRQWQKIEAEGGGVFGGTQNVDFNEEVYSLNLSQTIYQRVRIERLRQAKHTVKQARSEEEAARQELMTRLSGAYFNILSAHASLDFARAETRALESQLAQTRRRQEVGSGTSIDVEEARAGYDQSLANALQAENALAVAAEGLREITNDPTPVQKRVLNPSMPLAAPEPDDIEHWARRAKSDNPHVLSALERVAVAEKAVAIASGEHYPTLNLVGRQALQSSGGRFGDTDVTGSMLGVEFNAPLYQGGGVAARERQARREMEAAREQLERERRQRSREARENYVNTLNDIQRVAALSQAIVSAQAALRAIRAGFEAGTRTSVDVVTAERNLSRALSDHTRARYSYILNRLRLKQAAGAIAVKDLENVDRWLVPAATQDKETSSQD